MTPHYNVHNKKTLELIVSFIDYLDFFDSKYNTIENKVVKSKHYFK